MPFAPTTSLEALVSAAARRSGEYADVHAPNKNYEMAVHRMLTETVVTVYYKGDPVAEHSSTRGVLYKDEEWKFHTELEEVLRGAFNDGTL